MKAIREAMHYGSRNAQGFFGVECFRKDFPLAYYVAFQVEVRESRGVAFYCNPYSGGLQKFVYDWAYRKHVAKEQQKALREAKRGALQDAKKKELQRVESERLTSLRSAIYQNGTSFRKEKRVYK